MEKINEKIVLKIWFILLLVFSAFSILNSFNEDLLNGLFISGVYPLRISSMLLFYYVYVKGEKNISKYGAIAILVYLVFSLLRGLGVFTYAYTSSSSIIDRLMTVLLNGSGNCVTLLDYIALFTLIKSDNSNIDMLKKVAVICIGIFIVFSALLSLVPSIGGGFISSLASSIDNVGYCAYYAVIFLYFFEKGNISFGGSSVSVQQPVQGMNSQVVNQTQVVPNMNNQVVNQSQDMQGMNNQIEGQPQIINQTDSQPQMMPSNNGQNVNNQNNF